VAWSSELESYVLKGRRAIPGWFGLQDAFVFCLLDDIRPVQGFGGGLMEIGAYLGRSASVARVPVGVRASDSSCATCSVRLGPGGGYGREHAPIQRSPTEAFDELGIFTRSCRDSRRAVATTPLQDYGSDWRSYTSMVRIYMT